MLYIIISLLIWLNLFLRRFNSAKSKKAYTHRKKKIRKSCEKFVKEIWKVQVNETKFDSVFEASKTQHEGELVKWVHSLKKENKDLMANVNSCETRLSHVSESYLSQFHQNSLSKPGYDPQRLR